jgi:hypothetical protein
LYIRIFLHFAFWSFSTEDWITVEIIGTGNGNEEEGSNDCSIALHENLSGQTRSHKQKTFIPAHCMLDACRCLLCTVEKQIPLYVVSTEVLHVCNLQGTEATKRDRPFDGSARTGG